MDAQCSVPLVPILTNINPINVLPSCFFNMQFNFILGLPNVLFLLHFPTKTLYIFLPPHIRATCLAHLILHLITQKYLAINTNYGTHSCACRKFTNEN